MKKLTDEEITSKVEYYNNLATLWIESAPDSLRQLLYNRLNYMGIRICIDGPGKVRSLVRKELERLA